MEPANPTRFLTEPERLELVAALDGIAVEREGCLDALARVALQTTAGERAFVNLVTADRNLLRGRALPDAPRSTPITAAGFCPFVVATQRVLAVGDTWLDARTRGNPAVKGGVRAYLGVPMMVRGEAVGTVCVLDAVPRVWTREHQERLMAVAGTAAALLADAGVLA